jgi:hypothetical protein
MGNCQLPIAIVLSVFFAVDFCSISRGNSPEDANDPPVIGRKEPFCGAVGTGKFLVTMKAVPTQLQAGDSLTLTIGIRASGSWQRPPGRPDLLRRPEYAKFRERFHIENAGERLSPDKGIWEFDYHLRPKSEKVTGIPSLLVVYFRPGFTPKEKGFMTTEAPGVPLQVSPRTKVQRSDLQGITEFAAIPDRFYQIDDGQKVLRREEPVGPPNTWLLVLLAVGPPVCGLCWYGMWRRRYPDAARLAHQRRSRAAQQAVEALTRKGTNQFKTEALEVEEVLAVYLRQRMDFSARQPTPGEVARHLEEKGFSSELSARVADLFRACDAARFAPKSSTGPDNFRETAVRIISSLESEPCSSRPL